MKMKSFNIGGVVFTFMSDTPVEQTPLFSVFKTNMATDSLIVEIIRCSLPDISKQSVFTSKNRSCYDIDSKRYVKTSYYNTALRSMVPYALSEDDFSGTIRLYIDYDGVLWDKMLFEALDFSDILLQRNVLLLHSCFIEVNGEAILFSADSGVGKSTQGRLWETYRGARVINGDRAALKLEENQVNALGIPFCGTSGICLNQSSPLKAIVLLAQADDNKAVLLSERQAVLSLLGKITYNTWDKAACDRVWELTNELVSKTPVFYLENTPDERAVKALEEKLWM